MFRSRSEGSDIRDGEEEGEVEEPIPRSASVSCISHRKEAMSHYERHKDKLRRTWIAQKRRKKFQKAIGTIQVLLDILEDEDWVPVEEVQDLKRRRRRYALKSQRADRTLRVPTYV